MEDDDSKVSDIKLQLSTNIQGGEEQSEVNIDLRSGLTSKDGRLRPKPRLGLLNAITFIVGGMIGSGIFVSPKGALRNSGSVAVTLLVWFFCGILSMLLSFVYADLGSLLPRSGGTYSYILAAFGGLPAYLLNWTQFLVDCASNSIFALVFTDYLLAAIFGVSACTLPNTMRKITAATMILCVSITNIISVRFAAATQAFFTVAKLLILALIIICGIVNLGRGIFGDLPSGFDNSSTAPVSIALAIYNCMWAYGGYENANHIAEEIKKPRVNIPRAIFFSVAFVMCIYLLTNISYFTLLTKEEFLSSSAVAYTWGEKIIAPAVIAIPLGVMCSVYGTANGGYFTSGRIVFAAARQGHLPEVLSFLHVRTLIPVVSIVFNTTVSLLFLIPADINELINLVGFTGFTIRGLCMAAHIWLRVREKPSVERENAFKSPIAISLFLVLVCIFMVVIPLVQDPRLEFLFGVGYILFGLLIYFPLVYWEIRIPGFDTFTLLCQLLFECSPTAVYSL